MFKRIAFTASVALLALVGCKKEEAFNTTELAQIVNHGLGVNRVLSSHLALGSVFMELARPEDLQDAADALQDLFDLRAEGAALVTPQDDQLHIEWNELPVYERACTGVFAVAPAADCDGDNGSANPDSWCLRFQEHSASEPSEDALRCDGILITGRTEVRTAPAAHQRQFRILDAYYADLFSGFLADVDLAESSDEDFSAVGETRFVDDKRGVWRGEAVDLALQAFNDKARGGTFLTQTPRGRIYTSGWEPVGTRSALVTVQWRSQSWTGCVEQAQLGECAAIGHP